MTDEIRSLILEIRTLEEELNRKQKRLLAAQSSCRHNWSDVRNKPRVIKAHTIPGDPPGTMGVDRRFDCHVPEQRFDCWMRQCHTCGLSQTTERFRSGDAPKIPVFPSG